MSSAAWKTANIAEGDCNGELAESSTVENHRSVCVGHQRRGGDMGIADNVHMELKYQRSNVATTVSDSVLYVIFLLK